MLKYFIIIIFISGFFSSTTYAQYYESNLVDYTPLFIIKREVSKDIIKTDAEVLKKNKVKEVRIKNDAGKYIRKMLVNNFGYIEDYMIFDPIEEKLIAQWRFGYDANTNLTAATRREGRIRMSYILSYENNNLASIHIDSSGMESQYDFAYTPENKILKVTFLNLAKDSVSEKYFFDYDAEGRLINVTDEMRTNFHCSITYSNNSTEINIQNIVSSSFQQNNYRIKEESKSILGESKQIYTLTTNFFYNDNGLISEIKKDMEQLSTSEKYEYVFYTP